MNKKLLGGFVALAGAVALFVWWRRRQPGTTTQGGALLDDPLPAGLPAVGQVGGDVNQNVSPEIVNRAFAFLEDQQSRQGCFSFSHSDHVSWYFKNALGQTVITPAFTYPNNYCGNLTP